jgi:hypothetical protein
MVEPHLQELPFRLLLGAQGQFVEDPIVRVKYFDPSLELLGFDTMLD